MSDVHSEFAIINQYFPDLLEIKGNEFYFKDVNISPGVIYRSYIGYSEPGDSVKLRGKYITCMLYLEEDPHGEFEMDFDFELSDKACVALFDMGIRVIYWKDGVLCEYDREMICRRFAIKNIVEHE